MSLFDSTSFKPRTPVEQPEPNSTYQPAYSMNPSGGLTSLGAIPKRQTGLKQYETKYMYSGETDNEPLDKNQPESLTVATSKKGGGVNDAQRPNVNSSRWTFEPTDTDDHAGHSRQTPRPAYNQSVFRMPKIDLDPYDGNPKTWPTFIANFRDLVNCNESLSTQKMALLRRCLKPEIQQSLGDCLNDPTMYETALEELSNTYGHPHIISRAYIRTIINLPKLTSYNDYKSLLGFETTLRGAAASLKDGGYGHELYAGGLLELVVDKLPSYLQSKWGKRVVKSHPNCLTLIDFINWLHPIVKGEMIFKHGRPDSKSTNGNKQDQKQDRKQGRQGNQRPSTGPHAILTTSVQHDSNENGGMKKNQSKCPLCTEDHTLAACNDFKKKSTEERAAIVKENGCCLRCLKRGHINRKCESRDVCGVENCALRHHPLMHGAPRIFVLAATEKINTNADSTSVIVPKNIMAVNTSNNEANNVTILLAVVPITIKDQKEGNEFNIFGLLDSGAEATLILDHAAKKIGLAGTNKLIKFSTFHGQDPDIEARPVNFDIHPRNSDERFHPTYAMAIPELNLAKRKCNWPSVKSEWKHLADLDLPAVNTAMVTVLIGRDVRGAHDILGQRSALDGSNGPDAIFTPFGWCVVGPVPNRAVLPTATGPQINSIHCRTKDEKLREDIAKLWETEAIGYIKSTKLIRTAEDTRAMEILENTIRHTGERQEVGLMWRHDDIHLPNNRCVALKQLDRLGIQFEKDPEFAKKYDDNIQEYIKLKFIELVDPDDAGTPGRTSYISHHGNVSASKPDKVRIVLNCSARYKNISLNDVLLKGPDLLTSQLGILLRFRQFPVALVGDIEKMFHQVQVPAKDRSALRILYRHPGTDRTVKTYQFTRHVFGAVSSPTTCLFALRKTADNQREQFPLAASLVITHTYVDNLLYSSETEEDAIRNAREFKVMCSRGGFNVVQWMSTSRKFLDSVDPSELSIPNFEFKTKRLPIERVLGVLLDWEADNFVFKIELNSISTMRHLLQQLASIHDPLGLIAPVVLTIRILMQDSWRLNQQWDDPLPDQIILVWTRIRDEISSLSSLSIPRCIRRRQKPTSSEIHAFSDASEDGFGAGVYLRSTYDDNRITVRLILGKSRVTPLRQLSIPRLKLQGAVMAVRLTMTVKEEMDLLEVPTVYWTDSQTVLQWICSKTCRYHAFVAHRITEISDSSTAAEWRHVPGEVNPADDASRGIPATSLTSTHRWYCGPEFLYHPTTEWPIYPQVDEPSPDDPEVSPVRWTGTISVLKPHRLMLVARNMSDLHRFLHVVGWLARFNRNYPDKGQQKKGLRYLSAQEIRDAMNYVIRVDQNHYFNRELIMIRNGKDLPAASCLSQLTPRLDSHLILRVNGRLERGLFTEDIKHPIILHDQSYLARLIVKEAHERLAHASIDRTTHDLRTKYYILRMKQVVRNVVHHCAKCKLLFAKPSAPQMATLPPNRIRPFGRPFSVIGIDYFGPFDVCIGRSTVKRYGVMLTCFNTRAVHLETADTMDTDSFLLAFWRFADRRGCPTAVYSDNGTNLVAGEKELRRILENLDQTRIGVNLAKRMIEWTFSPPSAPHFGGTWESLIKSAKSALRVVTNKRKMTDEVFRSFLTRVEALLNDRPLIDVPVDPAEPIALSPSHFLIGDLIDNPSLDDANDRRSNLTSKDWKAAITLGTHFWRRWIKEFLPYLINRQKWTSTKKNLEVDDIVLLVDPNTPRGEWPLGRVHQVIPDSKGVVRSAMV